MVAPPSPSPSPSPAPEAERELDEPLYEDRPIPLATSVLWRPAGAEPRQEPGPLPIFIAQRVLLALTEHGAAAPHPCFGLLTGNVFRSPETAAPYLLIDSTIRLPAAPGAGAHPKAVLLDGWVVAQGVVQRTGDQVVGWYRAGAGSHGLADVGLTPAEAETHAAMFAQPWQVAITVHAGEDNARNGAVVRRTANEAWPHQCLAFYEVIDTAALGSDDARQSSLQWTNYRAEETALVPVEPPPAPMTPALPAPPARQTPLTGAAPERVPLSVLLPEQFADGDSRIDRFRSGGRVAAYGAVGVLAAVGLFRLYGAIASPTTRGASSGAPAVAATPQEQVDRAADTLSLAIAAFDLRAQLFGSRQMQCPELAQGLVVVEDRWTAYNRARQNAGVTLDSTHTVRDRSLYADADNVERRFERSGCRRP